MIEQLKRLAGFLLFDAVWFSAVAGRDDWLLATAALIAVQIGLTLYSGRFKVALYLELVVLGLAMEFLLGVVGVIAFTGGLMPLWLVGLWLGFAAMAMTALDWVKKSYAIALTIGLVSGPITYLVGIGLGAASAPRGEVIMAASYAVSWALFMAYFVLRMRRAFP